VTGVANYPALSLAVAKVSTQGHIAFLQAVTDSRLVVSTPDGGVSPVSPDSGFVSGPRVSPDGRRIAYTLITGRSTMARVLDRASGTVTALAETRPGVAREVTGWSGDGRLVLFEYDSGGVAEIHSRPYDKSAPESWFPTPNGASPVEASPDGVHVLGRFTLTRDDVDRDVWWWTVRDTTRRRFTSGPALDQGARFSPDGRWVAWTANEDGPREAFVAPFPGPGARLQISQGGVSSIAWARDGRGVYLAQANRIARVDIELGANPRVTGRRDVLHADLLLGTETFGPFDVGPSGEIVATAPRRERKVVVVLTATKPGDREP
jgi:Tol biopolymer transport system component